MRVAVRVPSWMALSGEERSGSDERRRCIPRTSSNCCPECMSRGVLISGRACCVVGKGRIYRHGLMRLPRAIKSTARKEKNDNLAATGETGEAAAATGEKRRHCGRIDRGVPMGPWVKQSCK